MEEFSKLRRTQDRINHSKSDPWSNRQAVAAKKPPTLPKNGRSLIHKTMLRIVDLKMPDTLRQALLQ